MLNKIKDYVGTLTEEIKYFDNAVTYKKSLEATLWGLEQQAQYPENSSKLDQEDLSEEINKCRVKVQSVTKLIDDQLLKIVTLVRQFEVLPEKECSSCAG